MTEIPTERQQYLAEDPTNTCPNTVQHTRIKISKVAKREDTVLFQRIFFSFNEREPQLTKTLDIRISAQSGNYLEKIYVALMRPCQNDGRQPRLPDTTVVGNTKYTAYVSYQIDLGTCGNQCCSQSKAQIGTQGRSI